MYFAKKMCTLFVFFSQDFYSNGFMWKTNQQILFMLCSQIIYEFVELKFCHVEIFFERKLEELLSC